MYFPSAVGVQSCVRLVDVDSDGRDDILIAVAMGIDMEAEKMTRNVAKTFCKDKGLRFKRCLMCIPTDKRGIILSSCPSYFSCVT